MKKIWIYISMITIGLAIGILIGAKFIVKETAKVEYSIRKIKNKNIEGDVVVTTANPEAIIKQIEALQRKLLELKNK
jgi:uncharacterized membrane protein YciS (DUF1049 family)